MAVKFARDIAKDIRKRGSIEIPEGYVTGEAFEKWLYSDNEEFDYIKFDRVKDKKDAIMPLEDKLNSFSENYGEAA